MFKNNKGFNLFTALISLMLLSITLVFIFNMVQTEENYLALIEDQSKSSDLLTIADISRADAFNNFVVSFREQWISFRSKPNSSIFLKRENVMLDWDSFVEYFANKIFFDNQFENYFANNVINSLINTNPPTGYGVSVPNYDKIALSEIIKKAFLAAGDKKIEVVGCQREDDNCLGTLYFTIDTRELSAQDYEKLPMVFVRRNVDDEVIQRPVFAKRAYRIYLPWRGFNALRTVRNFAIDADLEKKETTDQIISGSSNSQGLFNPYLHYTLNSAKLGICDVDSCALRTNLFKTSKFNGFTGADCKNPPQVSLENTSITGDFIGSVSLSESTSYSLQEDDSYRDVYKDLVKTTIKNNLESRTDLIYSGEYLVAVTSSQDCSFSLDNESLPICNIKVNSASKLTKEIDSVGTVFEDGLTDLTQVSFNPSTYNKASNLGLSIDADNNISFFTQSSNISPATGNNYLSCKSIENIFLTFKFEEQNEKYILSEDIKNIYVQLEDGFSDYTFYNPSYASIFSGGYFQEQEIDPLSVNNSWKCKSYEPTTDEAACVSAN